MKHPRTWLRDYALLAAALLGLAAGGIAHLSGAADLGNHFFTAVTVLVLVATVISSGRILIRGEVRVDVIAILAMTGALLLRQYLRDLRRVLYGLHAILVFHFAQEDELYSMLDARA